jgi:hypothetical protein
MHRPCRLRLKFGNCSPDPLLNQLPIAVASVEHLGVFSGDHLRVLAVLLHEQIGGDVTP